MKFRYIGTPKNITDLRSIASKHKQLERKNVKIAIVDNESFPMIEILQRHKFDIDKFDDIENIESLNGYDIILCDIQGVGTKFNEVFQGAYLVKEIYKRYPFKIIIAYTGSRYDPRYNEYLKYAEYNIIKDASSEEWVEKLDSALELASNPEHRWNRVRRYLLNEGVPLFELTLLEDDFVCRFLENKSFDDFPNNKIAKTLDDDIRAILQSFTANALFKILVG